MSGPRSAPTGATQVAGVIGDPIRHSLSPVLLNAAFEACGLDWVYVAFPVGAGDAARALDGMRALGIDGLSVTMPHKADVAALVDERTPQAAALGAVNCVVRDGERLVGHNTDGAGFLAGLAAETGFDVRDRSVLVLGAGGAARAVIAAVAAAGAGSVVVANRSAERGELAATSAGAVGRAVPVDALAGIVPSVDLVVNATSVGMGDDPASPLDPALLRAGQVVVDLVYQPLVTTLVAGARERGVTVTNGLAMLVHQAALAFTLWTGVDAPIAAMTAAVADRLAPPSASGGSAQ